MTPEIIKTESNSTNEPANVGKKEGKGKRGRGGKRGGKAKGQSLREKKPRVDYAPLIKDNENLVKFYKQQPFFEEGEFDKFMESLRETLPASFRINTFDLGQALFLRNFIQGPELNKFLTVSSSENDVPVFEDKNATKDFQDEQAKDAVDNTQVLAATGEQGNNVLDKPIMEPLSWYPKKFGWQMNISRVILRKTPILQRFHQFLMAETDNGFISRQETVSMIPPLLLDVHRGQNILDMCAAPGSKTAQLLEYLKYDIMNTSDRPKSATTEKNDNMIDDGIVVANDLDNKRCYMLVHQSSRLNSPNCVIINQDAARLPDMLTFDNDGDDYTYLKFDRILCDVPCAGDGTIRKSPDVWKKWSVGNSNNFHGMQSKILKRGVELMKKDGILVYSTCSMNPVEDEAVVATVLRASQGQLVLEDVAHKLVGLKCKPGVKKWVVMSREMEPIESFEHVKPESSSHIYPSLFPPTEEESAQFHLDRCIRILPHLQNTGGFFVAVLRKLTSTLPWEIPKELRKVKRTSAENKNGASNNEIKDQQQPKQATAPKKARFGGFKEDPFYFMQPDDPDWVNIKSAYGLSEDFPTNQLSHRCMEGKKRCIYLMSKRTRNFIVANREEESRKSFVKIINGGMRLFHRAQTEAGYRICQDGVKEILPYIRDDIKVAINKDDLVALLKSRSVAFDVLSSAEQIKNKIALGSFILIYKIKTTGQSDDGSEISEEEEFPLVAWKGQVTVTLYVSKTFRTHLLALAELKINDDGAVVAKGDDEVKGETAQEDTTEQ